MGSLLFPLAGMHQPHWAWTLLACFVSSEPVSGLRSPSSKQWNEEHVHTNMNISNCCFLHFWSHFVCVFTATTRLTSYTSSYYTERNKANSPADCNGTIGEGDIATLIQRCVTRFVVDFVEVRLVLIRVVVRNSCGGCRNSSCKRVTPLTTSGNMRMGERRARVLRAESHLNPRHGAQNIFESAVALRVIALQVNKWYRIISSSRPARTEYSMAINTRLSPEANFARLCCPKRLFFYRRTIFQLLTYGNVPYEILGDAALHWGARIVSACRRYSLVNLKLMWQVNIRIRLSYPKQFINGKNDIKTRANCY